MNVSMSVLDRLLSLMFLILSTALTYSDSAQCWRRCFV